MKKEFHLLPMQSDDRLKHLLDALIKGHISRFSQLFTYVPKTQIAVYMQVPLHRFNIYYFQQPASFKIVQFYKLGKQLGIDPWLLLDLLKSEIRHRSIQKAESDVTEG